MNTAPLHEVPEAKSCSSSSFAHNRNVANQTALVTGGSSGIGLAIAKYLADNGAFVTIADIDEPGTDLSERVRHLTCDVRQQSDVERVAGVMGTDLDLLVINAGIGAHEKLCEGDPAKWQRVFDTNVMGALRMIRACASCISHQRGGDIVVISSVAAEHQYEYGGVYSASKAALNAIAETLRLELQPMVRVLCVMLGVVDTPFFASMSDEGPSVESIGWGALHAHDVANAIAWAIGLPRHIAVNSLTMRPAAQVL